MAADEETRSVRAVLGSAADRLGVTPAAVAAGVIAVLAAGIGGWWALRAPDPPPAESVIPSIFDTPLPSLSPVTSTSARIVVLVDVGGAVADPGVHELRPDDRVVDAIRAAGGLSANADRRRLNMAMPVADGQRIWVPLIGEDEPKVALPEGGSAAGSSSAGQSAMRININSANSESLQTLPGIGPSLAASIITFRSREGPFARIDDLIKVPGIGQSKLRQIADLVSV